MTHAHVSADLLQYAWPEDYNPVTAAAFAAVSGTTAVPPRPMRPETFKDPLTGLLPRVVMLERGAHLMREARENRAPLSAVLLDIDCLKALNETYSPEVGDAALAHAAALIRLNIQDASDLAARNLGAEFVLLLPEADASWASAFAERLRGTLANRPVTFGANRHDISASVGVAALDTSDECLDDLIARARRAMRCAKRNGRNRTLVAGQADSVAA